ncbi:MAG: hypothetical protein ACPG1C_10305 [Alphaproteobacteria bacterium]
MAKLRSIAEVIGLFLVAASLFAVAYQIRLERKVAVAALNSSQIELFASKLTAGIGSDTYLSMWSKTYATHNWDHGNLSDIEVAAAELNAILYWLYAELTFEHRREGLVSDAAWEEFLVEVPLFYSQPAVRAVYEAWYLKTPSEFTLAIDEIVKTLDK